MERPGINLLLYCYLYLIRDSSTLCNKDVSKNAICLVHWVHFFIKQWMWLPLCNACWDVIKNNYKKCVCKSATALLHLGEWYICEWMRQTYRNSWTKMFKNTCNKMFLIMLLACYFEDSGISKNGCKGQSTMPVKNSCNKDVSKNVTWLLHWEQCYNSEWIS